MHAESQKRKSAKLRQLEELALYADRERKGRASVIREVSDWIADRLEKSQAKLATHIREVDQPLLTDETIRLLTTGAIRRCATELKGVSSRKLNRSEHAAAIEEILASQQSLIADVLSEKMEVEKYTNVEGMPPMSSEMFGQYLQSTPVQQSLARLVKMRALKIRPLEKRDIRPVLQTIYEPAELTPDGIVLMVTGQDTWQSLLFSAKNHEEPEFTRLWEVTDTLKRKKTLRKRREKQTFHGWVAHGPRDPDDYLALGGWTMGPLHAKDDRQYVEDHELLVEKGISRGIMRYDDEDDCGNSFEKTIFRKYMLDESARCSELAYIGGIEAGISSYTLGMSVLELQKATNVLPGTQSFTYAMDGLDLDVNGSPFRSEILRSQNRRSIRLLLSAGYELKARDGNPQGIYKVFNLVYPDISKILFNVKARPRWRHGRSPHEYIHNWAKKIAR